MITIYISNRITRSQVRSYLEMRRVLSPVETRRAGSRNGRAPGLYQKRDLLPMPCTVRPFAEFGPEPETHMLAEMGRAMFTQHPCRGEYLLNLSHSL